MPNTLLSRNGNELELVSTPWGEYLAVVFERVPGTALTRIKITDEMILGYGKALGEFAQKSHPCACHLCKLVPCTSWKELDRSSQQ